MRVPAVPSGDGHQAGTSLAAEALCEVGAISGISEFVVAEGPGWVSTPEEPGDEELAAVLADELGGKVSRFDC